MSNLEFVMNGINKGISCYHNVKEIMLTLDKYGFTFLKESESFGHLNKGKYYTIRNNASIIAFEIPECFESFNIVASHLDSPTFKIKPNCDKKVLGYSTLATEVYGGPIISTWLDRPLGIAGRVFISNNDTVEEKLIDLNDVCCIPNTAIHMNKEINKGYIYDHETDLAPMISVTEEDLMEYISKQFEINCKDILSYDLFLYNMDKAKLVGVSKDILMSPRIDNLGCAYGTLLGFLESKGSDNTCKVYVAFNHEEVGSSSMEGAGSTFLYDILKRIYNNTNHDLEFEAMLAKSFMVSADNGHAIHYSTSYLMDKDNALYMNKGIAIKNASNLSYTTDGYSMATFINILNKENVPYQQFCNKSGSRGGSTLGCISLGHVSIHSVDIGLPQLAMHSSCETSGAKDIDYLVDGIKAFFNYRK